MISAQQIDELAVELLGLLGNRRQVTPISARHADFDLNDALIIYAAKVRLCEWGRARTFPYAAGGLKPPDTFFSTGIPASIQSCLPPTYSRTLR